MTQPVILVDRPGDLPTAPEGLRVAATADYLTDPKAAGKGPVRIINLSRDLVYLGQGYYASLLADARGHKVLPTAATILALKDRGRVWTGVRAVEQVLLRALSRMKEAPETSFSIDVYFGRTADSRFARVAREAFDRFRAPILRVKVVLDATWGFYVKTVSQRTVDELRADEHDVGQHLADDVAGGDGAGRRRVQNRALRRPDPDDAE